MRSKTLVFGNKKMNIYLKKIKKNNKSYLTKKTLKT